MKTKVIIRIITLVSIFAFGTPSAMAGDFNLDGRIGFGVGGGMNMSLGSELLEDTYDEEFAAAAWFRYHLTPGWALELAYDHFEYDDAPNDMRNTHINLSVGYRFMATERSKLLVQVGAGLMKTRDFVGFADRSFDALGVKARLAYELMLGRDWAMNLNLDYHWADVTDDRNQDITNADEWQIFSPMIGLTYYFGGGPMPVGDMDGDGVTDDMDKCAGTAKGTAVGPDGCEVKKAAPVADSDYDGVPDADDQCPNTKMGKKVNEFGCSAKEKLEFKLDVKFDSGKWVVKDAFKAALTDFAEFMNKYPQAKAEIAGHTDSTGKESYNFTISQKRADAVKKYLVSNFNIADARLTAKGYGPSEPVGDNATAAGRKQNRRVVANVKVEVE